jgi:hypothetical protein
MQFLILLMLFVLVQDVVMESNSLVRVTCPHSVGFTWNQAQFMLVTSPLNFCYT